MRIAKIAQPTRVAAAVLVPLLIAVAISLVVIANQRQRARLQVDNQVRSTVAAAVTQVRTEVRGELAAAATATGATTVAVSAVDGSRISAATATQARDSGAATLDDTGSPPSIVVPVYGVGPAPATTAARRAAITGYRVVPLALQSVLATLAPSPGGLMVSGPSRLVAAEPSAAPPGARTFAVDMDITASPGWVVEAWQPEPGTPGITWVWVGGLLVLFGGLGAIIAYLLRRVHQHEVRERQVERNRALVSGLAPVLQASLDVGEVVPAAASHLSDGLGLAGLTLTAPGATGERQIFAWGAPADSAVRPSVSKPARIEPGQTYAVSLTRGGRVLGTLRVVAGEPLNGTDLYALTTASELLGSSLANAEAYARQQDLLERMRSVDELKTVFLATASHELRTPVTAIVGFSTLLVESWDAMRAEQRRGLIERVQANGKRLEALIEQLLDFSKVERGLPQANNEVFDLGRAVARILDDQPNLAGDHELRTEVTPGGRVRGSTAALERIVTNLVGNAAKYSPSGTLITVTVRPDDDKVVLWVDDEGSGVDVADRDKIFSRFYRGRGDSVIRTSGAGIGLAIVAEYAASMSGVASVQAAPGGGARFVVSFPAAGPMAGTVPAEGESHVAIP